MIYFLLILAVLAVAFFGVYVFQIFAVRKATAISQKRHEMFMLRQELIHLKADGEMKPKNRAIEITYAAISQLIEDMGRQSILGVIWETAKFRVLLKRNKDIRKVYDEYRKIVGNGRKNNEKFDSIVERSRFLYLKALLAQTSGVHWAGLVSLVTLALSIRAAQALYRFIDSLRKVIFSEGDMDGFATFDESEITEHAVFSFNFNSKFKLGA